MIYNKLAAYYDQFVDDNLNKTYLEIILKRFNKGTVADLGCGTGPLAISLAKLGFTVTATDISKNMLEIAYSKSIDENVKINFYIHNILDPLNISYDVLLMTSDVLNYLENEVQALKAIHNVSEVMNEDSIFIFDFLKVEYMNEISGYYEEINVDDSVIVWNVEKTNKTAQIRHKVTIDEETEEHLQTTFEEQTYIEMLKEANLEVVEKHDFSDRFIFVCKKEL